MAKVRSKLIRVKPEAALLVTKPDYIHDGNLTEIDIEALSKEKNIALVKDISFNITQAIESNKEAKSEEYLSFLKLSLEINNLVNKTRALLR